MTIRCACGCGMPRKWCQGRDNEPGTIRLTYTLPMPDGTVRKYNAALSYPLEWFQKNGVEWNADAVESQVVFGLKHKVRAILSLWREEGGTLPLG